VSTPSAAISLQDPPLDHTELLARVRFGLDDPMRLTQAALGQRAEHFETMRAIARSNFVRVTPRLFPKVHAAVMATCERLLLQVEPEIYIQSDPEPNAGAVTDGKEHVITLHSGLVQLLDTEELPAIIGHELGHAGYRHMVEAPDGHSEATFMFERRRAQEISADRIGLLSVSDPNCALRAEIKVACGLGAPHLTPDIDAFIAQISQAPVDLDAPWEAGSTHPTLALRFWAQRQFMESDVYKSLKGIAGGRPYDEVEREIEDRFHGAGSSHAFRATADHVHESLAWLGILIVANDNDVTTVEREVLVEFVGRIWADDAYAYAKRHGMSAVERRAKETLAPLRFSNLRARRRVEDAVREFAKRVSAPDRAQEMLRLIESAVAP
jgi:Peptidase family M48